MASSLAINFYDNQEIKWAVDCKPYDFFMNLVGSEKIFPYTI